MTEWGFSFLNAHLLPTWSLESNGIWELSIKNELELKRWNADMNESCTKWWKWRFFKCSFIFYSSQCGCAAARCLHLTSHFAPLAKVGRRVDSEISEICKRATQSVKRWFSLGANRRNFKWLLRKLKHTVTFVAFSSLRNCARAHRLSYLLSSRW